MLPNPDAYTPLIHEGDYDAPHGGMSEEQKAIVDARISRTAWAAGGALAVITVGAVGLGVYAITHQEKPQQDQSAEAPATPGVATSISASASESASESASPSPSKTSASPSPSLISPSAFPSPSASKTHRVVVPSPTSESPTPPAPETTPPAPGCTWETSGGDVTVGECGDHTAYNDEQHTGAHQLPVGMMFGNVCMKGSMVAIHYGGGYDLVDDHGYFPIPGPC